MTKDGSVIASPSAERTFSSFVISSLVLSRKSDIKHKAPRVVEQKEVLVHGAANHRHADLFGDFVAHLRQPGRDTRNGTPICAALMTISLVSRPVV